MWLIYISIISHAFRCNQAAVVSPDTSNATGEYYFITDNSTNKEITCSTSNVCHVECGDQNACKSAIINTNSATSLTLYCTALSSCDSISVQDTTALSSADIQCISSYGKACPQAIFNLTTTTSVHLLCDGDHTGLLDGNCYLSLLYAQQSDTVYIDCNGLGDCWDIFIFVDSVTRESILNANGNYAFRDGTITASNSKRLEMNCNQAQSCQWSYVDPPYLSDYAFKLFCAPVGSTCNDVTVTIPLEYSSTVLNYMELICPRKDIMDACNVNFKCDHPTNVDGAGSMLFSDSTHRFYCSNALVGTSSYDLVRKQCCPWIDMDDMVQNNTKLSLPASLSIVPTRIDATQEYYILNGSANYQMISCTHTEVCLIECNYCNNFAIYAGDTKYLNVLCHGASWGACYSMYIVEGPKIEANIDCLAYGSKQGCQYALFVMDNTESINIHCTQNTTTTSNGACSNIILYAQYANNVSIVCDGIRDCYNAQWNMQYVSQQVVISSTAQEGLFNAIIHADDAKQLDVQCQDKGCNDVDIYPPYNDARVFRLICGGTVAACDNVDIRVPNSTVFVENYMELICPRVSGTTYCDVRYYCPDISSSYATYMMFDNIEYRYECNDNDCCPWKHPNNITVTRFPTNAPTTAAPTIVTNDPTKAPTRAPITAEPSASPSDHPSSTPTLSPTTKNPTNVQTDNPSAAPTLHPVTNDPTSSPFIITNDPTLSPVIAEPTSTPSQNPSTSPLQEMSMAPLTTDTVYTTMTQLPAESTKTLMGGSSTELIVTERETVLTTETTEDESIGEADNVDRLMCITQSYLYVLIVFVYMIAL